LEKEKEKEKKLVYSIIIHGESCNFSNEEAGSWHGIISLKLERTNPLFAIIRIRAQEG
jgi:hypothetical protein